MSIQLIENEIRKFLSSCDKAAICLTGRWGLGKTFAWNKFLRDARAEKKVALTHYSYVSLFGVNSLDELKYAIFQNSINCEDIGVEPSVETFKSNTIAVLTRLGKQSLSVLQSVPRVKDYAGVLGPLGFLSVKDTIICIDDLERRGKNLEIRDVMGLVSQLIERKKCKVMLILNDDALSGSDSEEFTKYYEKVIDISLSFEPSPKECVQIAVSQDTKAGKMLADNCIALGIQNIRVIKKIERLIMTIAPMLTNYEEEVLRQAVQSLTLFGWSVYEPGLGPDIDYLKSRQLASFDLGPENTKISEKEASWNALLESLNFTHVDEFDIALLEAIKRAFLIPQ